MYLLLYASTLAIMPPTTHRTVISDGTPMKRSVSAPARRRTRNPVEPESVRFVRQVVALSAVALTVRLVYVWQIRESPFFDVLMGDARRYDAWAMRDRVRRLDWPGGVLPGASLSVFSGIPLRDCGSQPLDGARLSSRDWHGSVRVAGTRGSPSLFGAGWVDRRARPCTLRSCHLL